MTLRKAIPIFALLGACAVDGADTGTIEGDVLTYQSGQGTLDYSKSPTGIYLKQAGDPMTSPVTIYLVFYGANWNGATDARQLFRDFANGLSGSPLWSTLASYDDDNGHNLPTTFSVNNSDWVDTTYHETKNMTSDDVGAELDYMITSKGMPKDPNGVYWFLPDSQVRVTTTLGTVCNSVCGWHPTDVHSTYTLHAAFAINPNYCESIGFTDCDFAGGSSSPNDQPAHDAMAQVMWHETAETLSDPDGNGYHVDSLTTGKTKENGDACEGSYKEDSYAHGAVGAAQVDLDYTAPNGAIANTHLGSRDFLLQPMWQNADRGGCVRRLILNRPAAAIGTSGATGDLDANGVTDFLARDDSDGSLWAVLLDSTDGHGPTATQVTGGSKDMHTQIYGFADFNGDGSSDLLWRNLNDGKLTVWGMGGTTVTGTATLSSVDLPATMLIKAVGDFDGNGKADILFQDANTNATRTWFNWSWTAFDATTLPVNANSPGSSDDAETVGTGDFFGIGRAGVLWHDLGDDSYHLWKFTGSDFRTITSSTISLPGIKRVLGVVDVDRDGTADIVAIDSTKTNVIWFKMTGGVPGAAKTILAVPTPEWRFSGGFRSGIGGQAGLLWYNRMTGAVARWLLDGSGNFVSSSHLVGYATSNMQFVTN